MTRNEEPKASAEGIFQVETAKAVCIRIDESRKVDVWLPKAMVSITGKRERGALVTVTGGERFMIEKGLV